jgi:hypothetical protein
MSLKHVCRNCGWTDSKHLFRAADAPSVELERRQVRIPGYEHTLMACPAYTPGRAERQKINAEVNAVLCRHEEVAV